MAFPFPQFFVPGNSVQTSVLQTIIQTIITDKDESKTKAKEPFCNGNIIGSLIEHPRIAFLPSSDRLPQAIVTAAAFFSRVPAVFSIFLDD
jgi:hypothetical protein